MDEWILPFVGFASGGLTTQIVISPFLFETGCFIVDRHRKLPYIVLLVKC